MPYYFKNKEFLLICSKKYLDNYGANCFILNVPGMEWTCSIGRRNGLSKSRTGVGICSSTVSSNFCMEFAPFSGSLP